MRTTKTHVCLSASSQHPTKNYSSEKRKWANRRACFDSVQSALKIVTPLQEKQFL